VVLGIAGAVPDGFEARYAHDFAGLPPCPSARAELPEPKTIAEPHVLLVDKPTADSTAISIGTAVDFTRRSPDYPALQLFTDYVGLHRQSVGRLYHELRERRGLNYGDYAYSEYFEQDAFVRFAMPNIVRRQQMVSLWIRPVRPKNAAFALRAALHVYGQTLDQGIAQAELDRFRDFAIRYTSLEELTASRRLGDALDDYAYGARVPLLAGLRDAWKGLDERSLKAAVDRHLKGKSMWIAVITRDAAGLAEQLMSAAPTPPSYDSPKPADVVAADKEIARLPLGLAKDSVRVVRSADLFK
jgi:zinc protease